MTDGLLSPLHVVLLALALVLLFGPKRLPEIGRSLGLGVRSFREGMTGPSTPEAADNEPDTELPSPP